MRIETQHGTLLSGDCLDSMRSLPEKSVDLVFGSPPYENRRKYGDVNFHLSGQDWVDWAVERFMESLRVCRGLVAWVVDGKTENFRYSATPALLMADLHRAGVRLRKPPIYRRAGIFGSGGKDWLKNDWEFIVCASDGKLPWSDNTACGHPPKFGPGGPPSHRTKDGSRVQRKAYKPPRLANPGNIISGSVGGGHMGHELAHANEAPFPLWLAEFFVRSFCPPGGVVLDPFIGSGTTAHAAVMHGRKFIGMDLRDDQIATSSKRIESVVMPTTGEVK